MTIHFELDGNEFVALNGGPVHYGFDESVSFMVDCATDEEVDHYWERSPTVVRRSPVGG
jgi:predicted 3-demethylubiquinone-9 3-methyltransferase (glyoxalase superfamily)